ncbi:hypothetical protein V7166_22665, partial [Bacillus thuringiensis]
LFCIKHLAWVLCHSVGLGSQSGVSHPIEQQGSSWARKTYKFTTPSDNIQELKLTIAKEASNQGFSIDNLDVKEV